MTETIGNDGSHQYVICGQCGSPLELNVLARWPNGDIQEAEWVCTTDACHPRGKGWYLDGGTLDLGLVTDEQLTAAADADDFWVHKPEV